MKIFRASRRLALASSLEVFQLEGSGGCIHTLNYRLVSSDQVISDDLLTLKIAKVQSDSIYLC